MAIDKNTNWNGRTGSEIEQYVKNTFESKVGAILELNDRYLLFSDEENKQQYIEDNSLVDLIIGEIKLQSNYLARIELISDDYNAVSVGSTGNNIIFKGITTNLLGNDTEELINCEYTIRRNNNKVIVRERHKSNDEITFNVDEYLLEGTNEITISIEGMSTHATAEYIVTFDVINLILEVNYDISQVYDLRNGNEATLQIPYKVSGSGNKRLEWYIDGELVQYNQNDDNVTETTREGTKNIVIQNLSQGYHTLQTQVITTVNGEPFKSDICYNEFIVYNRENRNPIVSISQKIPSYLGIQNERKLYGIKQYTPYQFKFATYTPDASGEVTAEISLDNILQSTISSRNYETNSILIYAKSSGEQYLKINISDLEENILTEVDPSNLNLSEITNNLKLAFDAIGRTNNSSDKTEWKYNDYEGVFNGFNWNTTSGWVDGSLYINSGASFGINYAPLDYQDKENEEGSPTDTGKTIEFEFKSTNVSDDETILCNLCDDNDTGIILKATKIEVISKNGVTLTWQFKSDEVVRIGIVINKKSDVTNKQMTMLYINGIISQCISWGDDSYTNSNTILFTGSDSAEMQLFNIRIYDTALSNSQMLNNFNLYRRNISEMSNIYNRNDIFTNDGNINIDKLQQLLPVMIVTGDVSILEDTTNKDEQITVDVKYTDIQEPSLSFTIEKAEMRPQGTSSMGYPKKNFRIYTRKSDATILRDYNNNIISDKLYSFKKNAQPVDCWCLKADYAESSGTHNTGIARLWNNVMYNARIQHTNILGESVDGNILRTQAQNKASEYNYKYDVRTTIDGFPIALFYHKTENDPLIFLGKYNFNNDKSTPSVFGFEDIPGFINENVQCWEILNNGNPLALFTSTENFDTKWSEAFESRYPDTKTPNIQFLKEFCIWMTNVNQSVFSTQKWEHLDVYKVAAYYVYLMRFGAVDQTVKNAMFTTEDGQHWFYINYDNDTINGLTNDGKLIVPPTAVRSTIGSDGEPYYAGKSSRLWNMLEADTEFMSIVSLVDNALYQAGLRYEEVIDMFDNKQAGKWSETIYNQDAQYKYIGPKANLFMLQGNRATHRKWWLAKRFAMFDSKFVSGSYKSNSVEIKCIDNTLSGQEFTITSGESLDYGYGINNIPREYGVTLSVGDTHTFTTKEDINKGDPIYIYGGMYLKSIDLSKMASRLNVLNFDKVYDEDLGTKLTHLIIGGDDINNIVNTGSITGLNKAISLEYLDIKNMQALSSLDLSSLTRLKEVNMIGSGISSVQFAKGAPIETLKLSSRMSTLQLSELPYITSSGIEGDLLNVLNIDISKCPNLSNDFNFIYNWYSQKPLLGEYCTLKIDNVYWNDVDPEQLLELHNLKSVSLKGRINITSITEEQSAQLINAFGPNIFVPGSDLYIDAPTVEYFVGSDTILEGSESQYNVVSLGNNTTSIKYYIYKGDTNYVSIDEDSGLLEVIEGIQNLEIEIRARIEGDLNKNIYKTITVVKRTYPSYVTIHGNSTIEEDSEYTASIRGEYTGDIVTSWTISGAEEFVKLNTINDTTCLVSIISSVVSPIQFTLTFTVTRKYDSTTCAYNSITVTLHNPNIAESDPGIVTALYNAGLCESPEFITKEEAAVISDKDLENIIFSGVVSFLGLKYFTSLTNIPNLINNGNLKEIYIPSNIKTSSNNNAFNGCSLEKVYIDDLSAWCKIEFVSSFSNPFYRDINMSRNTVLLYLNNELVTDLIIPDDVTVIRKYAFMACSSIRTINTNKVESIGINAFAYMPNLEEITLGENLSNFISSYSSRYIYTNKPLIINFNSRSCNYSEPTRQYSLIGSNYEITLNIGNKVQKIPGYFLHEAKLYSLNIPDNVIEIGSHAFSNTKLSEVTIPKNITRVGQEVFNNNELLTKVIWNAINCQSSNALTFHNCNNLTEFIFGDEVTVIPEYLCRGLPITEINLPHIATIGKEAFRETSLTKIDLSQLTLNATIGASAFSYCEQLTEVIVPNFYVEYKTNAFYECPELHTVKIVGSSGLDYILGSFENEYANPMCNSANLYCGNELITSYKDVYTLTQFCFYGCTSLNSVTFTYKYAQKLIIPEKTFCNCINLSYINFENDVNPITEIGVSAFENTGAIQLNLPAIEQIKENAFYLSKITRLSLSEPGRSSFTLENYCLCSPSLAELEILNTDVSISTGVDPFARQIDENTLHIIGSEVSEDNRIFRVTDSSYFNYGAWQSTLQDMAGFTIVEITS